MTLGLASAKKLRKNMATIRGYLISDVTKGTRVVAVFPVEITDLSSSC